MSNPNQLADSYEKRWNDVDAATALLSNARAVLGSGQSLRKEDAESSYRVTRHHQGLRVITIDTHIEPDRISARVLKRNLFTYIMDRFVHLDAVGRYPETARRHSETVREERTTIGTRYVSAEPPFREMIRREGFMRDLLVGDIHDREPNPRLAPFTTEHTWTHTVMEDSSLIV